MKITARLTKVFIIFALALPISVLYPTFCWPTDDEALKIAKRIDTLYRSKSSYSEVEMEITTPNWARTLDMKVWTIGTENTFLRILAPRKDRGVATLRIGNEMWNYFPRVNKTMKIPPSMMTSSWMGSDFTNDDLVNEFTLVDDYEFELIRPEGAQDDLFYLQARPKEGVPVVWSSVLIVVRKADLIPVLEKYLDDNGKLIRTMKFTDIRNFDGRNIPAVMELVPADKKNHRTILRYKKLEFDRGVDESIMTLRNLRSFNE